MPLTRKGATDFATAKFVEWLRSLGHRRVLLQSDGEPAMIALQDEIRMQAVDLELILRESIVGDHHWQGNGAAEMPRSQVIGIENHLGARVPHGHALMLFALTRAAKCINCYRLGAEGKTPEELRTGRAWRKTMAAFGEMVLGFPLKEDSRKRDVEPKAVPGLYCDHTGADARRSILRVRGPRHDAAGRTGEVELQSHRLQDRHTLELP
eukprot:2284902-Amphidinium_carterae.1